MLVSLTRLYPLKVFVPRALASYVLLRALLVVVAALLAEFAGPEAASGLQSPIGVVGIAAAVGYVDVRRRRETILWANLGFSPAVAPAFFASAALLGELLVSALIG
jgi:hypothetical protein